MCPRERHCHAAASEYHLFVFGSSKGRDTMLMRLYCVSDTRKWLTVRSFAVIDWRASEVEIIDELSTYEV